MKIFILLALLLCSGVAVAQLQISASDRREATWDKEHESWNFYSTEPITTFFEFTKELSEFKTNSLEAAAGYLITKWNFDEAISKYTMDVQTKDGKQYEMVIDGKQNFIALFYWKNEKYYMIHFSIKESNFVK